MLTEDTLTDRYVAAVSRSVSAADRVEIVAEVRATIADEREGRVAAGEDPAAAEYAAIAGLGEPLAYAASLSGRSLVLIGPRFYAAWWRLLRLLFAIVLPTAAVIAGLVRALNGGDIGAVFGAMVPAIITSGVHVGFWTTLVFAVLERAGSTGDSVLQWTPDRLPKQVIPLARISDLIGTAVVFVILIGAVAWDRAVGWGQDHPHVLSAELWPGVIAAWFVLLGIGLLVEIVAAVRGRWTVLPAAVSVAAAVAASVGALVLIWQGAVLDPALVAQLRAASTPATDVVQIVDIVLTVVIAGILAGILFDAYRKLGLSRETTTGV